NVDPQLVEAHRKRVEVEMIPARPPVKLQLRDSIAMMDLVNVEPPAAAIAEPRERELPEELRDGLNDCTPQALLRDLHRPESFYEKQFEIVDMAAEQRMDIVAEVDAAMRASWKLPPLGVSPATEARELYR